MPSRRISAVAVLEIDHVARDPQQGGGVGGGVAASSAMPSSSGEPFGATTIRQLRSSSHHRQRIGAPDRRARTYRGEEVGDGAQFLLDKM